MLEQLEKLFEDTEAEDAEDEHEADPAMIMRLVSSYLSLEYPPDGF
jgi:hypothetical protein